MTSRVLFVAALIAFSAFSACSKDPPVVPPGPTCSYDADCPSNQVCSKGQCFATATCVERAQCKRVPVCADDTCTCDLDAQRCLPVCETDNECPADGYCLDGRCTRYQPAFNGTALGGGARKPLQIGIGQAPLDFPMGISMAGYATRRGPDTPYRGSLGGSHSWFDKPDVRAITVDNGEDAIIFVRLPLCWSDDFILTAAALEVQKRTGINVLDKLVSSAPHSHHQPARFWHLVVGLNFGIFGYDEFSWEIFDRISKSVADAIVLSLENRHPGKFGWTALDGFDPMNRIHRDRREQNNNLSGDLGKDDRMLLMRFDDMAGNPIALATNFGIHGTIFGFDNPMLTGDAPGGVEVILGKRASEKYQRPVMGLFLQGNAGDISPSGDDLDHSSLEQVQLVGERSWAVMDAAFDRIVTKSDLDVDLVTGRFPVSRAALGYTGTQFHDDNVSCENTPAYFRYGSFQCMDGAFMDSDPATKFVDGMLNCVFAVECLTDGFPIPQFMKTRLSVMRLGDLALTTMPGEPLSKFGLDNAKAVKAALPGVADAFTLGYSQDHNFYLTTEDDWFQGGYEPSRDIWGWKLAPYFSTRAVQLAGELAKPRASRVRDDGNLKPMFWDKTAPHEIIDKVAFTDTEGDPARVVRDVPATVARFDRVDFAWAGGHPGLDQPSIVLEKETAGNFAPVQRPGGAPYMDGSFEMIVRYIGDCNLSQCQRHSWSVKWEEGRDFPAGKYRFRVTGKAWKSNAAVDYVATSGPFNLVPSRALEIYGLVASGDGIDGRILDPRAIRWDTEADGGRVAVGDGHRLRTVLAGGENGTPLPVATTVTATATVVAPGGMSTAVNGAAAIELIASEARTVVSRYAADGTPRTRDVGMRATTKFHVAAPVIAAGAAGMYRVTLTLRDELGNSGTITATVTK